MLTIKAISRFLGPTISPVAGALGFGAIGAVGEVIARKSGVADRIADVGMDLLGIPHASPRVAVGEANPPPAQTLPAARVGAVEREICPICTAAPAIGAVGEVLKFRVHSDCLAKAESATEFLSSTMVGWAATVGVDPKVGIGGVGPMPTPADASMKGPYGFTDYTKFAGAAQAWQANTHKAKAAIGSAAPASPAPTALSKAAAWGLTRQAKKLTGLIGDAEAQKGVATTDEARAIVDARIGRFKQQKADVDSLFSALKSPNSDKAKIENLQRELAGAATTPGGMDLYFDAIMDQRAVPPGAPAPALPWSDVAGAPNPFSDAELIKDLQRTMPPAEFAEIAGAIGGPAAPSGYKISSSPSCGPMPQQKDYTYNKLNAFGVAMTLPDTDKYAAAMAQFANCQKVAAAAQSTLSTTASGLQNKVSSLLNQSALSKQASQYQDQINALNAQQTAANAAQTQAQVSTLTQQLQAAQQAQTLLQQQAQTAEQAQQQAALQAQLTAARQQPDGMSSMMPMLMMMMMKGQQQQAPAPDPTLAMQNMMLQQQLSQQQQQGMMAPGGMYPGMVQMDPYAGYDDYGYGGVGDAAEMDSELAEFLGLPGAATFGDAALLYDARNNLAPDEFEDLAADIGGGCAIGDCNAHVSMAES